MTTRLSLILCLTATLGFAQTEQQKDSIITVICKSVATTRNLHDTTRIIQAYGEHLYPFVNRFPKDQRAGVGNSIFFRLQHECLEFKQILDRLDPPKGDWKILDKKPKSKLSKKDCKRFLNYKQFMYLESSGDSVALSIENGYWIDRFKDGPYSKLKLEWVGDCEFDIQFIESDNSIRKNFSKPGDKYRYQVINQTEMYFEMSVQIVGTEQYALFRLYY
jgi:hypothetical protein